MDSGIVHNLTMGEKLQEQAQSWEEESPMQEEATQGSPQRAMKMCAG